MNSTPYLEGYDYGYVGLSHELNPYKEDHYHYSQWRDGHFSGLCSRLDEIEDLKKEENEILNDT